MLGDVLEHNGRDGQLPQERFEAGEVVCLRIKRLVHLGFATRRLPPQPQFRAHQRSAMPFLILRPPRPMVSVTVDRVVPVTSGV